MRLWVKVQIDRRDTKSLSGNNGEPIITKGLICPLQAMLVRAMLEERQFSA
jgi:hypothetical protein